MDWRIAGTLPLELKDWRTEQIIPLKDCSNCFLKFASQTILQIYSCRIVGCLTTLILMKKKERHYFAF
jgi:hypothetical protein